MLSAVFHLHASRKLFSRGRHATRFKVGSGHDKRGVFSFARRGALLGVFALLPCCTDDDPLESRAHAETSEAIEDELATAEGITRAACARCHAFPPPESLPRARWLEVIPTMAALSGPPGVAAPNGDELEAALSYYRAHAPEALEVVPPGESSPSKLSFRTEGFSPPGVLTERGIGAVSNVTFGAYTNPARLDVLFCELRSRTLCVFSPWAPPGQNTVRLFAKDLRFPAHVAAADLESNGRTDILVASLGDMDPTNDRVGAVMALRQGPDGRFSSEVLAEGLGRVADVRSAHLDTDGRPEIVVCAFGWRGPGELRLIGGDGSQHVLDERDGWIHCEIVDLDGDGRLDLVTLLSQEHEQVLAFLNRGDLRFEQHVLYSAPHPAWGFSGLEIADIDGDGDVDVLVSNGDTLDDNLLKPYHGVSWLENRSDGEQLHFVPERIGALYGCERAVSTDLDGDGDRDVLAVSFLPLLPAASWEGLDSVVWFEQQEGTWKRHVLEQGRCLHPTVAAADYDADGKMDFAVGNYVWMQKDDVNEVQSDCVTVFTQE